MMSAPGLGDGAALRDWATRHKEDVGMPSAFSAAQHSIPPLVDVPLEVVSLVLHGGLAPRGAWQQRLQQGGRLDAGSLLVWLGTDAQHSAGLGLNAVVAPPAHCRRRCCRSRGAV